jgi:hypothetical protein
MESPVDYKILDSHTRFDIKYHFYSMALLELALIGPYTK